MAAFPDAFFWIPGERGDMHARLGLKTQVKVAPQQVLASALLQASLVDLDQVIAKELAENPALERVTPQAAWDELSLPDLTLPRIAADPQADGAGALDDWAEQVAAQPPLIDQLATQLALLADGPICTLAVSLLPCLDNNGYLRTSTTALADEFGVEAGTIEAAIRLLHALEPPGIGARDLRECLQIQCNHLAARGVDCTLVAQILAEAWEAFCQQQWTQIARRLYVNRAAVAEAQSFIRHHLYPHPLALVNNDATPAPPPARADLIIQRQISADSFVYSIEVSRIECYQLRVNAVFTETLRAARRNNGVVSSESCWLQAHIQRARHFMAALQQRWTTLYRIGEYVMTYQQEFLTQGALALRPLTQAMVAAALGLHEATISRAVHDKYIQLPDGRLMALHDFFDQSLPAKETIRRLLAAANQPLSDQAIADCLHAKGIHLARRTVAKYREQLKIPVSYRRCG